MSYITLPCGTTVPAYPGARWYDGCLIMEWKDGRALVVGLRADYFDNKED